VVLMAQRPWGVVEPLPLVVVRIGRSPVRQGEPCPATWVIESGRLLAEAVDGDGRRLVADLLGPGELAAGVEGAEAPWTVTALRPARLRQAAPADVPLLLAHQTQRLVEHAGQVAWLTVTERIERRVTDLAARFGQPVVGGTRLPAGISQELLAAMVGASRESVNRAIRSLADRGVLDVEGRGRYVVRTHLHLVAP
jgi:CRP-like cAMP-binding protein